jgi:hypothetical protein
LGIWWSCRESKPLQKARRPAETLNFTMLSDAKVRETTCVYAEDVNGVNRNRFPFQGHIRRERVAYT